MNNDRIEPQGMPEGMTTYAQIPEAARAGAGWNCALDEAKLGGSETILFVEDEAFVRNVTSEVLRSAGYKVLTAKNADEALAAYREYRGAVDFLLTDVILPGETGTTLAGRLRREDPELKVLFVTGYAEQLGLCKGERAECLAKPFSTVVLLQRIKQLLDSRQAWAGEQHRVKHACGNA